MQNESVPDPLKFKFRTQISILNGINVVDWREAGRQGRMQLATIEKPHFATYNNYFVKICNNYSWFTIYGKVFTSSVSDAVEVIESVPSVCPSVCVCVCVSVSKMPIQMLSAKLHNTALSNFRDICQKPFHKISEQTVGHNHRFLQQYI